METTRHRILSHALTAGTTLAISGMLFGHRAAPVEFSRLDDSAIVERLDRLLLAMEAIDATPSAAAGPAVRLESSRGPEDEGSRRVVRERASGISEDTELLRAVLVEMRAARVAREPSEQLRELKQERARERSEIAKKAARCGTPDAAMEQLGNPTAIERSGDSETWRYKVGAHDFSLRFTDGKLTAMVQK